MVLNPRAELAEYLGAEFDAAKFAHSVYDEWRQYKDPVEFYKYNKIYLYHLTVNGQSNQRQLYYEFIREVSRPCTVIDYGCGIGVDALWLSEQYSYEPSFADYDSECVQYLKHRLRRREIDAPVYDVEKDEIPQHELAIALDVVDHVEPAQQEALLETLASVGELCIVNLNQRHSPASRGPGFAVDVSGLVLFLRERTEIVLYKIYNEYAHVLAFRSWLDKEEEE